MKNSRQRKILELIKNHHIETQDDLTIKLKDNGFNVTQATVSRDIKELGLIKAADGNSYKYFQANEPQQGYTVNRLSKLLQDSSVTINNSENLIVIKTLPGMANAIAACLDQVKWPEVIGSVAGDDTILIVVKPKKAVAKILSALYSLSE